MCYEQEKDFILGEADADGPKDEKNEEEEGQCSGVGVEICRFNLPPCAAAVEDTRILPLSHRAAITNANSGGGG